MSSERAELPGEDDERSWRDRWREVLSAGRSLAATRAAILREELSVKALLAAKGFVAVVAALALGVGVLLLGAALLVAVFAGLLKSLALGILATLVLYAAATVVLARIGWSALTRVEPFDFPATREELVRDWEAVQSALSADPGTEGEADDGGADEAEAAAIDLEERYRAGAE